MTTRILPHAEWLRLPLETGIPWQTLDPARNAVLVTETDGAISGCVVLMQTLHAEFLWVAPPHRGKGAVLRRLRDRLLSEARQHGAKTLLMAALSKTMNGIVCGLGAQRLPGDHYVLLLEERTPCRQQ